MEYRRAVLCLVLLIACVVAQSQDKEPKKEKKVRGKIIGGKAADISQVSYQVSLGQVTKNGVEHFCGGSIISDRVILTAAHCVQGMSPKSIVARTGSSYSNKGGQLTPVSQIVIHPQYNAKTVAHDIAMVATSQPITLGGIIKLSRAQPEAGEYGLVTGWGVTNKNSDVASPILNAVWVPFISRSDCRAAYISLNPITNNMICAGFTQGGKDACQGDSGGPIIHNGLQTGVVSWGSGCGNAGKPGVYTRVDQYLAWMQSNGVNV